MSADMKGSQVWVRSGTVELRHGEAGLADHPAAAADAKEGTDSSEEINRKEDVPGVPSAGKHIRKESLAQNLKSSENGDPGGGSGKSQGGIGLQVQEKGVGSNEESNPGQD